MTVDVWRLRTHNRRAVTQRNRRSSSFVVVLFSPPLSTKRKAMLLAAGLLAVAVQATARHYDALDPTIQVTGRWQASPPAILFDWSSVWIDFTFSGTAASVIFNNGTNNEFW